MAYMSAEEVKKIRDAIKKAYPNYKWSIKRHHHSGISIHLMASDIPMPENDYSDKYININHHYLSEYSEAVKNLFENVERIMKSCSAYHDNSDIMTDYFDVAYYYNFKMGEWDKPYQLQG